MPEPSTRYAPIAAVVFLLLATLCGTVLAAGPEPLQTPRHGPCENNYFYRGLGYGSDAAFHPVSELINGAFGVLQISSSWVPLDQIDWRQGFQTTWRSITHPGDAIDAYGRSDFITNEVIPGSISWNDIQYVPNYTLHMIGGGARHRAFAEWYEAHDVPVPTLMAWGTTIAHAFAVEAVEHYGTTGLTVDPVADMLIFDPLGALLFSSDRVAGFFAHTLNMSIWSGQPMYNPWVNTFENAGENYGLHFFFHKNDRVGIFSYMGMSHLLGVTVRGGDGFDWSIGFGGAVEELGKQDRGNGMSALFARVKFDAGLFLHRNGSLLASIHVSQAWTQMLRINMYPNWLRAGNMATGWYTGIRGDQVIVGMTLNPIPVGLAVSR